MYLYYLNIVAKRRFLPEVPLKTAQNEPCIDSNMFSCHTRILAYILLYILDLSFHKLLQLNYRSCHLLCDSTYLGRRGS